MTQTNLIIINNTLCLHLSPFKVNMYGRNKRLTTTGRRLVENHILSGRFISIPIKK